LHWLAVSELILTEEGAVSVTGLTEEVVVTDVLLTPGKPDVAQPSFTFILLYVPAPTVNV
jgi:hypothetical protein